MSEHTVSSILRTVNPWTPLTLRRDVAVIHLAGGYRTYVDSDLWTHLSTKKWYASGDGKWIYAAGGVQGKRISMARFIAFVPPGLFVDHKNRNTLDNRRCNLRVCTARENCTNAKHPNRSSKYQGVSFSQKDQVWYARIKTNQTTRWLGTFSDEESAARAYDRAAREVKGEFAYQNFPGEHS